MWNCRVGRKYNKTPLNLGASFFIPKPNGPNWLTIIEHKGFRITYSPIRARIDAHKRDKGNRKATEKAQAQPQACELQQSWVWSFPVFPRHWRCYDRRGSDQGRSQVGWLSCYSDPWCRRSEHSGCFCTISPTVGNRSLVLHQQTRSQDPTHLSITITGPTQRVRALIAICYMAFCCLQHLRKRLKMLGHPMSPARIRKELKAVQLSILRRKGTGDHYAIPSP